MQTKEFRFVDKSTWQRGPWDQEPDKVQWQDEATGMLCLAIRHMEYGHWCGYVGVGKDHPAFKKDYDDVDVSVHGGLTFAGKEVADPEETDGIWWLGFDCAHSGDASPGLNGFSGYKKLEYVKSECTDLAEQLKDQA